MKILSTDTVRRIDRFTIEHEGVSSLELIRRMADAVASEVMARFPASTPVTVFAGQGNNGADALVVTLRLFEAGYNVEAYLFNIGGNSLSADCKACRASLLDSGFEGLHDVEETFKFPYIPPESLVIDGLFGTGLREPLSGGYTSVARAINESEAAVISIDIPSGMFGEWNSNVVTRDVIHATVTMAAQFPRLSFFLSDNAEMVGEWKVVDIGLSRSATDEAFTKYYAVGAPEVRQTLKARDPFSSKGDYGRALVIAGCGGMMGAAVLCARGALRAGVGKLTVHSARIGFTVLQTDVPEALFESDRGDKLVEEMIPRHTYDAIGVGPGLGTNEATVAALDTLIKTVRKPLVLDADALNIISRVQGLIEHLTPGSILTPHEGEFDRLFGEQASAEARLLKAIEVSRRHKVIIVLKGRFTATVRPDETVFFNTSGTPALATPGSGDVLTGVITGLLAQGYDPDLAAMAGVYVHGVAGELAAQRHGQYGVLASDIAQNIGAAINKIMNS